MLEGYCSDPSERGSDGGSEKRSDARYILKVDLAGFAGSLKIGCEKRKQVNGDC